MTAKGGRPSAPVFLGDDWRELRDAQWEVRDDTLAEVVGKVTMFHRHAIAVMAAEDDRVAAALDAGPFFDAFALYPPYVYLAGAWRHAQGHVHPSLPGMLDLSGLVEDWRGWAREEPERWFLRRPTLVRRFAVLTARSLVPGSDTIVALTDLLNELRAHYPLPPVPR
jgi:hypothetical protein